MVGGVNKENMYTIEELEQEAIKRYGEDWRNVKIKEHADGLEWFHLALNLGRFSSGYKDHSQKMFSIHGCIYYNGKWASPLTSNIHTDIQSLKDKYPQFNITVSVEERKDG